MYCACRDPAGSHYAHDCICELRGDVGRQLQGEIWLDKFQFGEEGVATLVMNHVHSGIEDWTRRGSEGGVGKSNLIRFRRDARHVLVGAVQRGVTAPGMRHLAVNDYQGMLSCGSDRGQEGLHHHIAPAQKRFEVRLSFRDHSRVTSATPSALAPTAGLIIALVQPLVASSAGRSAHEPAFSHRVGTVATSLAARSRR